DDKHLVFATSDADFNNDIWVTRSDGTGWRGEGAPINVTRHPLGDSNMSISYDGRVLTFGSQRSSGMSDSGYDIYRVYLDPRLEGLQQPELEEYYKELSDKVKKIKLPEVPEFAKERGTVSPLVRALATRPTTGPSTQEADDEADDEAEEAEEVVTLDDFPLEEAYLRMQRVATGASRPLVLPDASAIYYSSGGGTFRNPWNGSAQRVGDGV